MGGELISVDSAEHSGIVVSMENMTDGYGG